MAPTGALTVETEMFGLDESPVATRGCTPGRARAGRRRAEPSSTGRDACADAGDKVLAWASVHGGEGGRCGSDGISPAQSSGPSARSCRPRPSCRAGRRRGWACSRRRNRQGGRVAARPATPRRRGVEHRRSGSRSRVMTGTARSVNSAVVHRRARPRDGALVAACASWAIADALLAGLGSEPADPALGLGRVAAASTPVRVPTTVASSRSTVTSTSSNQPSGSRPATTSGVVGVGRPPCCQPPGGRSRARGACPRAAAGPGTAAARARPGPREPRGPPRGVRSSSVRDSRCARRAGASHDFHGAVIT